ncbi:hypothetical protein FQN57_000863 [Myotisia sp. PD_48]|nr:hypothetical protein FQN57_000863 [Myotisia sp. PD_48]
MVERKDGDLPPGISNNNQFFPLVSGTILPIWVVPGYQSAQPLIYPGVPADSGPHFVPPGLNEPFSWPTAHVGPIFEANEMISQSQPSTDGVYPHAARSEAIPGQPNTETTPSSQYQSEIREARDLQAAMINSLQGTDVLPGNSRTEYNIATSVVNNPWSNPPTQRQLHPFWVSYRQSERANDGTTSTSNIVNGSNTVGEHRDQPQQQLLINHTALPSNLCALCDERPAICQYQHIAGGIKLCGACYGEILIAEQEKGNHVSINSS